jgi:putative flippase GtrA
MKPAEGQGPRVGEAGRFGRFLTVGVSNTLLTFVVFNVLVAITAMPIAFANAIAYSVGIVNSFIWQRRWTFRDRAHLPVQSTLPRFVVSNLGGLALTTGVVAALEWVGLRSWLPAFVPRVIAVNLVAAIAIGAGLVWNYLMMRFWVFAAPRTADDSR